jgi:hypothetical protein
VYIYGDGLRSAFIVIWAVVTHGISISKCGVCRDSLRWRVEDMSIEAYGERAYECAHRRLCRANI